MAIASDALMGIRDNYRHEWENAMHHPDSYREYKNAEIRKERELRRYMGQAICDEPPPRPVKFTKEPEINLLLLLT